MHARVGGAGGFLRLPEIKDSSSGKERTGEKNDCLGEEDCHRGKEIRLKKDQEIPIPPETGGKLAPGTTGAGAGTVHGNPAGVDR